ncbi:MAG TPA: hypothetical protein VH085_02745 [Nocardioides sp.]|nr:hypothetical protein [Nocardioides sp.]
MATPAPGSHPAAHEAATVQTVTYRGPTVLMGAFAHLLREEGLEFERPSDDRRGTEAAVEVVMSVSAVDPTTDRTLDERIDAAVTSFRRRFGDDSSSVEVGPRDDAG